MENLIENKELSECMIYVMFGKNYAQIISKESKVLPSTIVRRLQKLEKYRLLKSKKEKLLNRTRYEINWSELSGLFCKFHPMGKGISKKITKELFQDERFIEIFKAFAIQDVLFIGNKKISLEKVFDDFVNNLPKSHDKDRIKDLRKNVKEMKDKIFLTNLKEFIEWCEYYNREASPIFSMNHVIRKIIKEIKK